MKNTDKQELAAAVKKAKSAGLSYAQIATSLSFVGPQISASTVRRLIISTVDIHATNPLPKFSKGSVADSLMPLLLDAQTDGWTCDEISRGLASIGVNINVNTLRAAMRRHAHGRSARG